MAWVAVGLTAAGATSSYLNNQAKKKQETANQMANAAQIQFSPWTHANAQVIGKNSGSDIAQLIQGGLGGAMFAQQLGKGKTPDAPPQSAPEATGSNSLGGNDMAAQMGSHGADVMKMAPQPPPMPMTPGVPMVASNGATPGAQFSPGMTYPQLKKPTIYGSNY